MLPPRSTSGRKGVFSTRSPHRPNPIGMSVVRLERMEGLTLHILDSDMLDGTPVLDIKPYVAYSDAHPGGGRRLAGESGARSRPIPSSAYVVEFDLLAAEQAAWIETCTGLAIGERIRSTLSLGPEPHPYRRIRRTEFGHAAGGEGVAHPVQRWPGGMCARAAHRFGLSPSQLAAGDESMQSHRALPARSGCAQPGENSKA